MAKHIRRLHDYRYLSKSICFFPFTLHPLVQLEHCQTNPESSFSASVPPAMVFARFKSFPRHFHVDAYISIFPIDHCRISHQEIERDDDLGIAYLEPPS